MTASCEGFQAVLYVVHSSVPHCHRELCPQLGGYFGVCCWAFHCQPKFSFLTDLLDLPNITCQFACQFPIFCYCHLLVCPGLGKVRLLNSRHFCEVSGGNRG